MFIIGLNYWSKKGGPLMWEDFDPKTIEKELQQMKSMKVDVIRAFAFWPDFEKTPGSVDPVMMDRARQFFDLAESQGVKVYMTFIVGHMSGENWDPSWKRGDFFQLRDDVKFYISTLVKSFKDHPALGGWILSNELVIYANSREDVVSSWIKEMIALIKSIDNTHPVSTGDGYWGVLSQSTFNPFDYGDSVDYHGPHSYTPDTDSYRQSVFPQIFIKLAKVNEKPVILEEFGASSVLASDERIAGYYRVVLAGSLAAGASGAWGWCYSDFDLKDQRPYSHHPHEMGYGVTTADWKIKPQGQEIRRFADFLDEHGLREQKPLEDEIGLLVPSYVHESYPFTTAGESRSISSSLQASYYMLIQNRVNPKVIFEKTLSKEINDPSLDEQEWPKILFLPYALRYTAKTQDKVKDFVERGGSIVISYAFNTWFDLKRLGIETDLYFNYPYALTDIELELGDRKLEIKPNSLDYDASIAPVKNGECLVCGHNGERAVVKFELGQGKIFLITFPFERWVSASPRPFELYDPHLLYGKILNENGVKDRHETWSKWIQGTVIKDRELVINHSWDGQPVDGFGELKGKDYALLRSKRLKTNCLFL